MMSVLRYSLAFCIAFQNVYSSNIFAVFPIPSVSHQNVFSSFLHELAKRGHEVTAIITNPIETDLKNYKQINVGDLSNKILDKFINDHFLKDDKGNTNDLTDVLINVFDAQLSHKRVEKLINDKSLTFDVCFFEATAPPMFAFKDVFNCPVILMNSLTSPGFLLHSMGAPTNPALYPCVLTPFAGQFSFYERVINILDSLKWRYLSIGINKKYNDVIEKHFRRPVRKVENILEDAEMLFMASHEIFSGIRPLVPAIIHIGGLHIKEPKPLPKNLRDLLDKSSNGVVYVSLGSTLNFDVVDKSSRRDFIEALGELPYTVILKWKGDATEIIYNNIHVFKWLPQQDLLAHNNVKVFVTHGGQQSIEEALHYGVPMVALGMHADGLQNAEKIDLHGIGKRLVRSLLTKDYIRNTILQVADNQTYKSNVKRLRDLIYDQPQSSMDRAIWWTEYVIRHKGAKHLKAPPIPFLVEHYVDIISFMIFIIFIFYICFTCFLKRIRQKHKQE